MQLRQRLCALVFVAALAACGDDGGGKDTLGATDTEGTTGTSDGGSTTAGFVCPDDDLEMALPIELDGTTLDQSDDFAGSCSFGDPSPDRAFLWTAPEAGVFSFDTLGSAFDTVLYVLDGECSGAELGCNDDLMPGELLQSAVSAELAAGQTVTIVVDGFGFDQQSDFRLRINGGSGTCPDGALDIGVPSTVSDSTDGAIDASSAGCGGQFAAERSYTFTPETAGAYTFDTIDSAYDTVLYVLDGTCEGAELACSDDVELRPTSGAVVDLESGQAVTVVVDGASGQSGAFDLTVGAIAGNCPDGDLGSDVPINVADSTASGTNTTGSSCGGWFAPDLAYTWSPPQDGVWKFDTLGSDFDTVVSLQEAACGGDELVCNDNRSPRDTDSVAARTLLQGETVVIVVDGIGHEQGNVVLNIDELPCPEIDLGSDLPHTEMADLTTAIDKVAGSCGFSGAPDLILGWTAPTDGTYSFDTFGSLFDTVLYALDANCSGMELACSDDFGFGLQSRVELDMVSGQTVVLVVEGFEGETGAIVLNIQ